MLIGIIYVLLLAALPVALSFGSSEPPWLFWPLILLFGVLCYWMGQILERAKHEREAAQTYHLMADSRRIREQRFAPPEPPKGPSGVRTDRESRTEHVRLPPLPTPPEDAAPEDPGLTLT